MIKYRAEPSLYRSSPIEIVEIDRETEKCVWIRGIKNSKKSDYYSYFDTFAEAKSYLIDVAKGKVEIAKRKLDSERSKLEKANGLKEVKPCQN